MAGSKEHINSNEKKHKANVLFFHPRCDSDRVDNAYKPDLFQKQPSSFFKPIHRKKSEASSRSSRDKTELYVNRIEHKGCELSSSLRKFFEPRFGYDFSDVKIHNDAEAANSAQDVNALAYTFENNIVFGENKFQPHTSEGKKLLAHELAHVVQNKEHNNATIKRKEFKSTGRANEETPELINETVIKSSLLAKYAGADRIKAAFLNSDNFHVIQKYELEEYGKKCEQGDIVDKAGGFFCRNVKDAKDKNLRGDIFVVRYLKLGYVIHEFMHKLSGPTVKNFLGVFINEGVTQYFTDLFLKEGKYEILTDHGYGDNLECAKKIISKTDEDTVAKAYFNNDTKLISDLQTLLGLKSFNDVNPYFKDHQCIPEKNK